MYLSTCRDKGCRHLSANLRTPDARYLRDTKYMSARVILHRYVNTSISESFSIIGYLWELWELAILGIEREELYWSHDKKYLLSVKGSKS